MQHFLDTSAIVKLLRNNREITKWFDETEEEIVSGYVCAAELFHGALAANDPERSVSQVKGFFRKLSKVYDLNLRVAEEFGKIKLDLQKKGQVIDDVDIMIAAICISYDMQVVTFNAKHFARIEGLKVLAF